MGRIRDKGYLLQWATTEEVEGQPQAELVPFALCKCGRLVKEWEQRCLAFIKQEKLQRLAEAARRRSIITSEQTRGGNTGTDQALQNPKKRRNSADAAEDNDQETAPHGGKKRKANAGEN